MTNERYARPDTTVTTSWVAEHLHDPKVRIVEVDVDTAAYQQGHIPGALGWNWNTQLCDTQVRDIIPSDALDALMAASGIGNETTIVLYGDNNNWFAAWAFWQLKLYGHRDVRIMNGGRKKWLAESRELTTDVPHVAPKEYAAAEPDLSLRAFLAEVQAIDTRNGAVLVDVRSPQEFTGEILAPPGLPETCQRGGHIPGARSIPWAKACDEDGTFKSYQNTLRNRYRFWFTTSSRMPPARMRCSPATRCLSATSDGPTCGRRSGGRQPSWAVCSTDR